MRPEHKSEFPELTNEGRAGDPTRRGRRTVRPDPDRAYQSGRGAPTIDACHVGADFLMDEQTRLRRREIANGLLYALGLATFAIGGLYLLGVWVDGVW